MARCQQVSHHLGSTSGSDNSDGMAFAQIRKAGQIGLCRLPVADLAGNLISLLQKPIPPSMQLPCNRTPAYSAVIKARQISSFRWLPEEQQMLASDAHGASIAGASAIQLILIQVQIATWP